MYAVSSFGRVKSIERTGKDGRRVPEKIMSGNDNGKGYLSVTLTKNGKSNRKYIHRLVAQAFIPNPNGLTDVNHIDEIKSNNNVGNLEWVSHRDNMNHGTRNERVSKMHIGKICSDNRVAIVQMSIGGDYINEYASSVEAAKSLGSLSGNIRAACNGSSYSCSGFLWCDKNEYCDSKVKELVEAYDNRFKHRKKRKFTDDGLLKIKELAKKRSGLLSNNKRCVYQFSIDGKLLKKYPLVKYAAEACGLSKGCISACARGRQKTSGGFVWKYYDSLSKEEKILADKLEW